MTKKEKGWFSGIFESFGTGIFAKILQGIGEKIENFGDQFQDKLSHFLEKLLEKLMAFGIMFVSFIFLILSAIFYLNEFRAFSKAEAFFIGGIFFLLIGLILKYKSDK